MRNLIRKCLPIIALGLFLSTGSQAANLFSSVVSNGCSQDFGIRLTEFASSGTTKHYAAWSDRSFPLKSNSCEIRLRLNVPNGYKVQLKDVNARGKVALFSSGASVVYGISVRSEDGLNYMGTSANYVSSQQFHTRKASLRGTGTTCGQSTTLIIRHDAMPQQAHNVDLNVDRFAYYVDLVRC